jgi:regulator of extracellular matrix RemA (YlzA/DUF370 family)
MTYGRPRKAVIIFESGHIVLAPISPEEIEERRKEGK